MLAQRNIAAFKSTFTSTRSFQPIRRTQVRVMASAAYTTYVKGDPASNKLGDVSGLQGTLHTACQHDLGCAALLVRSTRACGLEHVSTMSTLHRWVMQQLLFDPQACLPNIPPLDLEVCGVT
jgi:hypothetical protein